MALDITILPLSRIGGQDQPSLPGLMAAVPPRKAARGRQQDRLVVYLLFGSEAALSTGDCVQAASRAAITFYETPGTLTAALRTAARSINEYLYSRNQARTAPGQYTLGMLALAAIRESQVTMLSSGPMHAFVIGKRGIDHISDPLSGRGLGMSETFPYHFSQLELQFDDRLILCSRPPASWASALKDSSVTSLEFDPATTDGCGAGRCERGSDPGNGGGRGNHGAPTIDRRAGVRAENCTCGAASRIRFCHSRARGRLTGRRRIRERGTSRTNRDGSRYYG